MLPDYPIVFRPIFKERIWGGRSLESYYNKSLPSGRLIGESWEISDRPGDESTVINGKFTGASFRDLLSRFPDEIMGKTPLFRGRFPWLIKLLDARQDLSLQVHPPPALAEELGGEPKDELWYVAHADVGAKVYAGLKHGVTKQQFEEAVASNSSTDLFHEISVNQGDSLYLPSGRVHALGSGLVIFEIQQNSDSTYRVHDWNRPGIDGKLRELHISESLRCINFGDFEPGLIQPLISQVGDLEIRHLIKTSVFEIVLYTTPAGFAHGGVSDLPEGVKVIGVISGRLVVNSGSKEFSILPGSFGVLPNLCRSARWHTQGVTKFLVVTSGLS